MPSAKIITTLAIASIFALSVASFSVSKTANAQIAQDGMSLLFSPPLVEIVLQPGESHTQTVRLDNRSGEVQVYYPFAMDFVPRGEDGGQEFLSPADSDPSFSLAQWISLDSTALRLQPGEREAVTFRIDVPENAEPGGRYAAVFFGTQPTVEVDEMVGARIATQTGPVVLIRVAGDVLESASIIEYGVGESFYEYPPVSFMARVENLGNVHVKPVGEVVITDVFGRTVANLPVNEKQGNILPHSIRRFDIDWNKEGFTMGRFTAGIALTYGSERQQTLVDEVTFWVIPWKVLTAAILALIVIILLLKLGMRKYNESVIRNAMKNNGNGGAGSVASSAGSATAATSGVGSAPASSTAPSMNADSSQSAN